MSDDVAGAEPEREHLLGAKNLRPSTPVSARKMRESLLQTSLWLGAYVLAAIVPLAFFAVRAPAARSVWVELGVALGIIGFAMLALQFVTMARLRHIAPFFGSDAVLLFHRKMGILALLFVVAHPIVLLVAEPSYLEYLDVRVNAPRTIFLALAMLGLALLVVVPLFREKLRLSYEWFRLSHAVFAAGVLVVGLVHGLQVGHYVSGLAAQLSWLLIALAALGSLAYVRLVKPWLLRRRPYRVAEVREEHGDTWTLVLRPEGHDGIRFVGGQFAWITLGRSPLSLQQHPFSIASSARAADRYEITIKALGDFTGTIEDVKPGARVFLDGPYGSFTLGSQPMDGAVFIMGGIGITPAMSILRTCRDAGDQRPMVLVYANRAWEEVAFKEELEALERELDLRVVHVLEDSPEGWEGERGFITEELLDRHLPRDGRDYHYFVCGPPKMMDLVEKALSARGVPIWNRSVERFSFA